MIDEIHNNSRVIVGLLLIQLVLSIVTIILLISLMVMVGNITPETEAIETTECTSAPVTDILPEPTETIPTEPTETVSEATEASVTPETEPAVSQEDIEMLACVIYQEAGGNGSCDNCRRYVGDIVLNRVNDSRFPNTIYDVLTAQNQYGRFHWTGIVWADRAKNPGEAEAVARAYRIAEELLTGQHSDLYGNGYIWQAGFPQGSSGFWCCGHYYGK